MFETELRRNFLQLGHGRTTRKQLLKLSSRKWRYDLVIIYFKIKISFWIGPKLQQEQLEKKKAENVELMKNKIAQIHKQAEEKRAMIEARRGEEVLKAEELAAKYRATGTAPKKLFGCMWYIICEDVKLHLVLL